MKKSHIGIGVVIVIVILAIIGGAVWRQQKHSMCNQQRQRYFSMVEVVVIMQKNTW